MEGGGWSSFAAPLPDAHPASPVHYYSALYRFAERDSDVPRPGPAPRRGPGDPPPLAAGFGRSTNGREGRGRGRAAPSTWAPRRVRLSAGLLRAVGAVPEGGRPVHAGPSPSPGGQPRPHQEVAKEGRGAQAGHFFLLLPIAEAMGLRNGILMQPDRDLPEGLDPGHCANWVCLVVSLWPLGRGWKIKIGPAVPSTICAPAFCKTTWLLPLAIRRGLRGTIHTTCLRHQTMCSLSGAPDQ